MSWSGVPRISRLRYQSAMAHGPLCTIAVHTAQARQGSSDRERDEYLVRCMSAALVGQRRNVARGSRSESLPHAYVDDLCDCLHAAVAHQYVDRTGMETVCRRDN